MAESTTLYLIDGTALAFRGYYAIDRLTNDQGMPTNAVYGFGQVLRSYFKEWKPEYLAVAFDLAGGTFREASDDEYKAHREPPPADLLEQWPWIRRLVTGLGIRIVECPGYEADDVIGTLAVRAADEGMDVVIFSPDKDMLQLISPRIAILRDHGKVRKTYDREAFLEKYSVPPERMVDLLGLMGDSVDNIPGVPGVGEKTAIDLIKQFGSLEGVYDNLDQISGKKRVENLKAAREDAFFSRDMATIETNVELGIGPRDCRVGAPRTQELAGLYRQLGFRRWLQELEPSAREDTRPAPSETPEPSLFDNAPPTLSGGGQASLFDGPLTSPFTVPESVPRRYRLAVSGEDLGELAAVLRGSGGFAFDTETTGLDEMQAGLVGLSFSTQAGEGWYVPVGHHHGRNAADTDWRGLLAPILEDASIPKYAHNAKYDIKVLAAHGIEVRGLKTDTMIAAALVDTSAAHNLDACALRYLGMSKIPTESLIGRGAGYATMAEAPVERVGEYAAEDADATFRLVAPLEQQIDERNLRRLLDEVEMPLLPVLVDMERTGVRIDREELAVQCGEAEALRETMAQKVYETAGVEFNLNSTQQLAEILFDKMRLPSGRKRSTQASVLERLAAEGHRLPALVLEYRHVQKIKSTYLDALEGLIHPRTGRVHTSYRQMGANTGRLASSDPNLQNIPVRTPLGKRVRQVFVPSEGCVLLSADYSQIELRIVAHLADDPGLREAFAKGEDIHRRTAAEIFGVSLDDVTDDQRASAKAINFGLIYGMSAFGLASRQGIGREEARDYMNRYFSRYPGVQNYINETLTEARQTREVSTLMGRRIRIPGIDDRNRLARENAERAAINAPVQGSAADMMKVALVQTHQRLHAENLRARMILTVHDEIILDVPQAELDEVRRVVVETMKGALPLNVPIEVDTQSGSSWGDL